MEPRDHFVSQDSHPLLVARLGGQAVDELVELGVITSDRLRSRDVESNLLILSGIIS
jgi:hypothetical protein